MPRPELACGLPCGCLRVGFEVLGLQVDHGGACIGQMACHKRGQDGDRK